MRIDRERGTTGNENHAESPEHVRSNQREPGAKLRDRLLAVVCSLRRFPRVALSLLTAYAILLLEAEDVLWWCHSTSGFKSVVFHVHAVASVAAGFAGWRPAGSLTAP